MKRINAISSLLFCAVVVCPTAMAQQRTPNALERWDAQIERRTNPQGERDIEIRRPLDPDPAQRYRGTIERDGDTRLRNLDGDTLRGNIDRDGYGRLRDSDNNSYRVRPR